MESWMTDLFNYKRRYSTEVRVGDKPLGGDNPIRLQSMTTTNTLDTQGCVEQAQRIIDAGGDYVRLTTQGVREAENLKNIREGLPHDGSARLVADVHFNPHVAEVAALYADKVRINPGNYVDPARTFKKLEYTDEEYADELKKIEERLLPLLQICREHHTALRIGVNHGSLSDRIMSRYGDTPEGIVESCMEFLRILKKENFNDVVISIKASNTVVMVRSVRLLVDAMDKEDMHYPLHLGVTEAGEGEDGRIKSAVGIGALLCDGIGDTIRVSLSEEPEREIPVARDLVDVCLPKPETKAPHIDDTPCKSFDYLRPERRKTMAVAKIGGNNVPVAVGADFNIDNAPAKLIYMPADAEGINDGKQTPDTDADFINEIRQNPDAVVVVTGRQTMDEASGTILGRCRAAVNKLMNAGLQNPVIFRMCYDIPNMTKAQFQLTAAADMGALMIDGFTDGVWLDNSADSGKPFEWQAETSLAILQAARLRTSKTEYISCPGCGRTLYDLRTTIAKIKAATKDLVGLKIGIMGCIVNGPGEMADADYGYVGAGRGKISLYRRKECVAKNIPEEEAVERLLQLINDDRG